MRVLVACEYSGIVRDAFKAKDNDAISCDLLPTESKGYHWQGDIFQCLQFHHYNFDLMIAHPPCTYLCNSGARWLYNSDKSINTDRWQKMKEAALFFKELLDANIHNICIENPIMHRHALEIIGVKQSQIIQPYQFGHTTSKKTCLWLKGLPKLIPTHVIDKESITFEIHRQPPSPDRSKIRSKTFEGIAFAMANQWNLTTII